MKKTKFTVMLLAGACVLSTAFGFAACGSPETPKVESGESTTLVTSKAPDELTPENAIYAFLQKQSELKSYHITTTGEAVANIAGYRQDIHNSTYKNGDDFLNEASSSSVLVQMKHQSFSKGGKVVYRNSFDGEMKVAEKSEYKKVYGFTADEVTLGGYVINSRTLRYAELRETEGDTLTYYFRLAGDQSLDNGSATESATAGVRLQAKAYGSLDNLPSYSDVDCYLKIKKDWTPVSYSSTCSYVGKKVFEMSIEQSLTSTYSLVNETVEIPDVKAFNEKLGSAPSVIEPEVTDDPTMQLIGAFGNSLDEKNSLEIPVSANVAAFGTTIAIDGDLKFSLKQDGLQSGNYLDAASLRLDLDLSEVPLLSGFANTLTVRYPGEGLILLTLSNKTETGVTNVFTYSVDLTERLSKGELGNLTPEGLQAILNNAITIEKTEAGYTLTLRDSAVDKLNAVYAGFIEKLTTTVGDARGFLSSLVGIKFTAVKAEIAEDAAGKLSGLTVSAESELPENVTLGEKIGVSIDFKLFGGAFAKPFTGDLDIRLDPTALWTGNYFAIAKAHLRLDLKPAAPLLQMLGAFGSMIPDLPSYINSDLSGLDIYYPGDGILTLAFCNQEGLPMGMTEVNLMETISQGLPGMGGTEEPADPADPADPAETPTFSLFPFTLTVTENGVELALGEPAVRVIAAAYNDLVKSLIKLATANLDNPMMGVMAQTVINGWLGANITGVGFFIGRDNDGKATFSLTVTGCPASAPGGDRSERALLTLTLTDKEPLTESESKDLVADKAVKALKATNEKATGYAEKLQKFIDEMDVTDAGYPKYVEAVTALQNEIDGQDPAVKTLMSNGSYLAVKTYKEKTYSVLLLTAELYRERISDFRTKFAAIDNADDAAWEELNALYEKAATIEGISVPAIKECEPMIEAIGETLTAYQTARNAHEDEMVKDLAEKIAASKTNYENASDRTQLTAALTEIVTAFKPAYDKLPADKQANVTGYSDYVKDIYLRNLDGAMAAYQAVQTQLETLDADGEMTIDEMLDAMKQLSLAYAWGYGYDYWETNTDTKVQPWGTTWITSLKPTDLSTEEQEKINNLNTINSSFMKGTIANTVFGKYPDLIKNEVKNLYEKIGECRIVTEGEEDRWQFEKLGEEADSRLLEKIHGLRFLICKVLPTSIVDEIVKDDSDLYQFARIDLTKYEKAFADHLNSSAPQA